MSRKRLFFVPKSCFTEYLLPAVIGRKEVAGEDTPYQNPTQCAEKSALLPDSVNNLNNVGNRSQLSVKQTPLTPELTDKLLGKAPLRLITKRELVEHVPYDHVPEYKVKYFLETLECSHIYTAYVIDPGAPLAKRRRCIPCKTMLSKKPSQSVGLDRKEKTA